MDRIVIYDVPDEGKKCLGRDVWHFWYFERRGLVLDYYAHEERDSLRQKFKPRAVYNRLSNHDRGHGLVERLEEKDAPLPDWVKERARDAFMEKLLVLKWTEAR